MYTVKRTNSNNPDFQNLIQELDKDLAIKNGSQNDFFKKFNNTDQIHNVIVIYQADIAVGCGAFKKYNENTIEIKRMFVPIINRNKGIASQILTELQTWAIELG